MSTYSVVTALGDTAKCRQIIASEIGSFSNPVTKIWGYVPGSETLQQTCDQGNTTTTDLNLTGGTGRVRTGDGNHESVNGDFAASGTGKVTTNSGDIQSDSGNITALTGRLIGNRITPASGTIVDITTAYRAEKFAYEFGIGETIIPLEHCRGDIVYWRNGAANIGAELPTFGVRVGFNVTLINSSGVGQRVKAGAGGRLDGLGPPNFINMTGTGSPSPYAINIYCIAENGAGGNTWYSTFV
jgi:hypothetical protein